MPTQSDPPAEPSKSKAKSPRRTSKAKSPEVIGCTVTKVVRRVTEPLAAEKRRDLVAMTAYYLAESRNFEPGHEHEDWLAAEAKVQASAQDT